MKRQQEYYESFNKNFLNNGSVKTIQEMIREVKGTKKGTVDVSIEQVVPARLRELQKNMDKNIHNVGFD
jgi:hypothetical protein